MELRQLDIFEAVVEAESFTAAAARLGYVQSNISTNMLALERELGVPLFDRLGRRVQLTAAGARFLPHVRQIREVLEAAKAAAADTAPSGRLFVGACESPGTYRLPALIARMHETYPAVDIHIRVMSPGEKRQESLRNGRLDVAIALDDPDDAAEFISEEVRREPIHLVMRADHPLASTDPIEWDALAGYQYLATEPGSYRAQFESQLLRHQVLNAPIVELVSIELIKQCILAGLGYGVLPVMTVEREVAAGDMVTRAWPGAPEFMPMRLVRHKNHWVSPALQAFWNVVTQWNAPAHAQQSSGVISSNQEPNPFDAKAGAL